MNNKLKIVVTGAAGAGKTSMAVLIERALNNAGFENTELHDIDIGDSETMRITMLENLDSDRLDTWKAGTDVVIETVQLSRTSTAR